MAENLTEQEWVAVAQIKQKADSVSAMSRFVSLPDLAFLLLRALAERDAERDQAQKSLTVLRTLMQGERLEVACSQRDEALERLDVCEQIGATFWDALKPLNLTHINVANPGQHVTELRLRAEQAEAALAKERIIAEEYLSHAQFLKDSLATERHACEATLRGLREALTKIMQRALQDSPDDVEAEIASGRTINDMYVLAKSALAAQPDAPPKTCILGCPQPQGHEGPCGAAQPDAGVGEGKRCSGCGGRGRHAFGCPRDFSSPPAPHAGQESK